MKPNLNLVRDILKQVYIVHKTEPLILKEDSILSPMGDGTENNASDHVHLMVERGLLIFSNRIKSNRKPDFATIEPTEKAKDWAYCAHDDAKWQQVENEILEFLTSDNEATA